MNTTSLVRSPSNIALIKYMGKKDLPGNVPENGSISITLDALCTYAEIRRDVSTSENIRWVPELPAIPANALVGTPRVPELGSKAIGRALRHLARVKSEAPSLLSHHGIAVLEPSGAWELRTANTFPAASGIASSASSFAAITVATALASADDPYEFERLWTRDAHFRRALARLARVGSGSSCRSLEGPFVLWQEEETTLLDATRVPELAHLVLLVSEEAKAVSSSDAHSRVKSSPLWNGRVSRVQERIRELRDAIAAGDLTRIAQVSWREAWEMHSLFHTSDEPFSYWTKDTMAFLQWLAPELQSKNPPIVTLDAGPNVHILVRESDATMWAEKLRKAFPSLRFLRDCPGSGTYLILGAGNR